MDQSATITGSLFDEAVANLHAELDSRLAQLHTRRTDIGRLQALTSYLCSHSWRARADVASHHPAGVVLRLWINVGSEHEKTELLRDIASQGIEIAREEAYADFVAYSLTLSDRLRVLLRVGICYRPTREAA